MPRQKKSAQGVVPTTALVASAHRYVGKAPRIYSPDSAWQKRCYHHYRMCGEARFAARYFGHSMSRADLFVAGPDGKRKTDGAGAAALDDLFSGSDGQSGMLDMVGVHLVVAGECYIIGRNTPEGDIWEVLAVTEVISSAAGWQIKAPDSDQWLPLTEEDVVIRVWVPSPDRRWEADSPFRSLLPVLDEVEWISRYIHAQASSRLTGAGLLVLPEGMTFPPPPPIDGKEQETANDADSFMLVLGENMMEPIKDPSSATAMVPLVITAPDDAIGDIKHLTFWTQLDENAKDMRQDAIHRFAIGMDLPAEMVLGMGSDNGTGGGRSNGVSHWGAWMIEEQAIKLHVEPMLDVLCAALTSYYVRPSDGAEATDVVRYDTTTLRLRPDRSKEAIELLSLGLIKPETVVKENGFEPGDMMTPEERQTWLLMKIASGSATPEQVGAALKALGVDLGPVAPEPGADTRETPQPPSLEDHPTRPKTPERGPASLLPTYEALALRALERAGNRLRNIHQIKTRGHAFEAHTLLEANGSTEECLSDAWSTAEMVLDDAEKVVPVLDAYCRDLIEHGKPHSRTALADWCLDRGVL